MKKSLVILFIILLLCGCKSKENIIKEHNVDYIEYSGKKLYLDQDFTKFITQFSELNCKFIPRNAESDKEVSLKGIKEDNQIFKFKKGNSFIITCNNENNDSSVNFTSYFNENNEEEYTNKKIKEWHLSSTSETLNIVISKVNVKLGTNEYETVKTLKNKLGNPNSESKTDKGNLERLIYINEDYKYQFLVLNPINNNEDNVIYNLYVEKLKVE